MAKKSANSVAKWIPLVGAVLGLAAVVMLFVDAIAIEVLNTRTAYTGLQVTFGFTKETEVLGSTVSTKMVEFSFMNLLAYLCAIGGIVLAVLSALGKGSKFFSFIAAALFVVAAVLFFLTLANTMMTVWKEAELTAEQLKDARSNYSLQAGPIVAGVCSILAAISCVVPVFLKK